jgi:hypothetical protein
VDRRNNRERALIFMPSVGDELKNHLGNFQDRKSVV